MIYLDARKSAMENRDLLAEQTPTQLAESIINDTLNRFISDYSSTSLEEGREDSPIPYQGWFWRSVDFFGRITIASGDGQLAICESNKWGYPERSMSDDERDEFRRLVWAAYVEALKGGNLAEIRKNTVAALEAAGEYVASLPEPTEREW